MAVLAAVSTAINPAGTARHRSPHFSDGTRARARVGGRLRYNGLLQAVCRVPV